MKKCLLNEEQKTLKSNNKIVKFDYEHYIDACKVMAVCPKCGKPTRLAHKIAADGTKSRVCKNAGCGQTF